MIRGLISLITILVILHLATPVSEGSRRQKR
jgi:hypothetical protein